jgi:hypothetical protein
VGAPETPSAHAVTRDVTRDAVALLLLQDKYAPKYEDKVSLVEARLQGVGGRLLSTTATLLGM